MIKLILKSKMNYLMKATFGAIFLMLTVPMMAQALPIDFTFYRITSNNVENIEDQLSVTAYNQADAASSWSQTINNDEVLFVVQNHVGIPPNVGIPSNIAEVYFDDGGLLSQSYLINSLDGFTNFTGPSVTPSNLPGGNEASPPFDATVDFGADVVSGPPDNGVNTEEDALGIVIALDGIWSDLESAVQDGSLRVGLHVRSIGSAGGSDSFISNGIDGGAPIPEPTTMLLLGSGLVGFVGFGRKKLFNK